MKNFIIIQLISFWHKINQINIVMSKTQKITKVKKNKNKFYNFFVMDDIVYFELKGRKEKDGIYAMVSADKWLLVSRYDWYLGKSGYPLCYQLGKMSLHRFVFTYMFGQYPPANLYVDHIDHNKLNNTDANLRLATPQENSFNKSTKSNKKGVRKNSDGNYTSTIVKNGIRHEIKNIPTEIQAAEIYNIMAEELFGHFAAPNKINGAI
jgi:hypothetical protein